MANSSPAKLLDSPSERIDMSDLADWSSDRSILSVGHDPGGVSVQWDDGARRRFPGIWLRDNCACPECRHPQAKERRFVLVEHSGPIVIDAASLAPGGSLAVRFASSAASATHESRYDAGWLRHHAGSGPDEHGSPMPLRRLWDAQIAADLPTVSYAEIMQSDAGLAQWLGLILEYGFALMRGAPAEPGELLNIAGRIQRHPHPTNFGVVYDVRTMPDPNASADTSMALEPHTDLANWHRPPDVQLLFCVANEARGGESVLVDGCRVAEELRKVDADAFSLLNSEPVEFRFHDADCDIRHRGLTIETGADGSVKSVRFNNWLRTAFDLPQDRIEPMYRALLRFWNLLREPRFRVTVKLDAGDMLTMNNLQVMHGREAFDPRTGRRHLQGCYVDLDMIRSRLRVLSRRSTAG